MRLATCHPERRHKAKGLCARCYYYTYSRDNEIRKGRNLYPSKRAYFRLRNYGITQEAFLALLSTQNQACAICKLPFGVTTPHVDHNHITKKVRGLLCVSCNLGLGKFKDDLTILGVAIAYLREHA